MSQLIFPINKHDGIFSSTLKSLEFSSSHRSDDDQMGILTKKPLEILFVDKSRTLTTEPATIKTLPNDPDSKWNSVCVLFLFLSFSDHVTHPQAAHLCRHCSSPCLHRNNPPCLPIPSLLSSTTSSSSSNSSSSPSSPSHIYFKTHPSLLNSQDSEEIHKSFNDSSMKFIPPLPLSSLTSKENFQLTNHLSSKYTSIPSSCSTMVTPTASLLSSVTTTVTPSSLFAGNETISHLVRTM